MRIAMSGRVVAATVATVTAGWTMGDVLEINRVFLRDQGAFRGIAAEQCQHSESEGILNDHEEPRIEQNGYNEEMVYREECG